MEHTDNWFNKLTEKEQRLWNALEELLEMYYWNREDDKRCKLEDIDQMEVYYTQRQIFEFIKAEKEKSYEEGRKSKSSEKKEELVCMKCGSKKNLNTNKDKSFVECDECMWGNGKSEKQEEWREKIKQMVLTDCFKDQPDIQRYIDFIEQLLSESKEKAKIEVLEKVLEKKTNYEMEREEHGYRVTLEYVLADDIKKEIKLLKEKE